MDLNHGLGGNMDQEGLKLKLINVIESGLNARAIAKKINITYDILAKFKQGRLYLAPKDYEKLESYLDMVVIP